eukprot:TRINITY_DN3999_c0_g1_i1.p1 TRINITY_DN3999_c0_g1~~TRINITY_DN3999_c0_g1_i1.p1  ORF type:complete len:333 (-),score=35.59 TRINITY_DN3999_c0_g1_i1:159-1157(-)
MEGTGDVEPPSQHRTPLTFQRNSSHRRNADSRGHGEIAFETIDRNKVHSDAARTHSDCRTSKFRLRALWAFYWVVCAAIGIVVGLTQYVITEGLGHLQGGRIRLASALLLQGPAGVLGAWFGYTVFGVGAVMIGAALTVFVAPNCRGGGIAEVKSYLNGIRVPNLLDMKAYVTKVVATICSVGGGLCVGQEGPMVHIGAAVAYNITQFKPRWWPALARAMRTFQNAKDRKEFITMGSAAGVAAAFRAPIGGVLFGFEELSSYWSHQLIYRTFVCCLVAVWSTNVIVGGLSGGLLEMISEAPHVVYRVPLGPSFKLWEGNMLAVLPFSFSARS